MLVIVLLAVNLAGCQLLPWWVRDQQESPEDIHLPVPEELRVETGDLDRALEAALAASGKYLIVADEREELELVLPQSGYSRVVWMRRELKISLPEEVPLDACLARLQAELAGTGGKVLELDEEGTGGARVVMLTLGVKPVVKGQRVTLATHRVTLLQGKPEGLKGGKLALIIDDLGAGVPGTRELMSLDVPLTFAVLPFRPYSRQEAQEARERGFEVLLHLPMEPLNEQLSPGPGAITVDMSPEEVKEAFRAALAQVPEATGVNNHMGSRATAREEIMRPLLEEVQAHGLFFVDSLTSARSVGRLVGRELGVPIAVNRLFLDNQKDVEAIKKQLHRAAAIAVKEGEVVAICHVHPATVRALQEVLPELESRGVELVFVSRLVK